MLSQEVGDRSEKIAGVARIPRSVRGLRSRVVLLPERVVRIQCSRARVCYAEPWFRMRPRTFVFITMLALCHSLVRGQVLTNALPPQQNNSNAQNAESAASPLASLPDDPGQEALPIAQPEPIPPAGVPVQWKADRHIAEWKPAEYADSTLSPIYKAPAAGLTGCSRAPRRS